jgi:hypothetical protein
MVVAFSFCIYNPHNPLYYNGLLENIEMIHKHFPTAYTYVYVGNDVPDWFVIELRAREKMQHVIVRFTKVIGAANMVYRFFAIDEPEVDIMFCRDADSRVHWKDRWAINSFLNSNARCHVIRDNVQHQTAIMGGIWGMRKVNGLSIRRLYTEYLNTPDNHDHGVGHDQNFLIDKVYPKLQNSVLIHTSQVWKRYKDEVLTAFPFPYTNDIYCGRIENINYVEPPMPVEPPEEPTRTLSFLRK